MSNIFRDFTATLRRTQFMPPERMLAYQRGLLERLVDHARTHVPFYRDSGRLDPLFRRDGGIDWSRWSEVPRLTRADVQAAGAALHADSVPDWHGGTWTLTTSGSTAEPVSVRHSELSGKAGWSAILARDLERHGIGPTGRLANINIFTSKDFDIAGSRRFNVWFPGFAEMGLRGERFDLSTMRPIADLIDAVVDLRPACIRAQPILVELMCAHDRGGRLARLGIEGVIVAGEHLSPDSRRSIEQYLGCRIVDVYASNELGQIASSCPHCGRFHVHSEVVLAEIIGDDGRPAAPGETGWVIVTQLYNYIMPLIRYDHVDRAQVGAPGGCAITLPALDAVAGKERDAFTFTGGVVIRPTLPTRPVVEYLGAQAYQVAQVAFDRCEFRFVPGHLAPAAMQLDAMTALLRSHWWQGLQVDYRTVVNFGGGSARAKVKMFVCELPGRNEPTPGGAAQQCYARSASSSGQHSATS